jgi:tetratricopeptide (TPR) repeat protein
MALTLVSMGVLALAPSSAVAQQRRQPADAGPTAEQRTAAREAYGRGQAAFQSGEYETAEAAFREAYEAVPNPIVLVSIAESQERLGNLPGSVETLERYLAERADAPDRAQIEAKITEFRSRPATLVVSSTPTGANITIDGEMQDDVTPAEIEVPPGEHTIAIGLEGFEESTETLEVVFGERREHAPVLTEAVTGDEFGEEGEGGELEEEEEEATDDDEATVSTGVWITSAIAGVGLITGTVLGFLALSEQSDFDDTPTEESADQGQTFALFADVAFGVAIAAAVTAVVLYFTGSSGDDDDESSDDEDEASASLDVLPAVSTHGGGLAARLSF